MKTKVCVHCHKRKSVSHFSKATRYNYDDGLTLWCKECFKDYRKKNKDKIKIHSRKYYLANLDEFKRKRKIYNKSHRKERIKYLREKKLKDPTYFRNGQLKTMFGITYLDYQEMLESQNGVCAICGKSEFAKDKRSNKIRQLAVDHNHATGKVRALLCHNCNTALGRWKDNVKIMKKAIKYLEKHND
jgi:hypothetical protein